MKRYLLHIFLQFLAINVSLAQIPYKPLQEQTAEKDFIFQIKNGFDKIRYGEVIEKVYLHLNKAYYYPGDTIWFRGYLVDMASLQLSDRSNTLYIDLINDKGDFIFNERLYVAKGLTQGSFTIPTDLKSGNYHVRAYTNWMKNFDPYYFFNKNILIYNIYDNDTSKHKEQIIPNNDYDLHFFPEGGHMVYGLPSRVGFKAIDKTGSGIFLSGRLFNNEGKHLLKISTKHDGMGSFSYIPQKGKTYYFVSDRNDIRKEFVLPEALQEGYVINVNNLSKDAIQVLVRSSYRFHDKKVLLLGQSRGKIYFDEKFIIKKEGTLLHIPKTLVPEGVLQLTLFDNCNNPVCERLIFVRNRNSPQISLETSQEIFSKREKVDLRFKFVNQNGNPVKNAIFSISISDADQHIKHPYSETITSYFLLLSDLKGKITNPGYYFKDQTKEAIIHLDLLMLTHGWRRFTWQKVLNVNQKDPLYNFEKGINLSGTAYKEGINKLLKNGTIQLLSLDDNYPGFWETQTDENGQFIFSEIVLPDNLNVIAKSLNKAGKPANVDLKFDKKEPYPLTPEFNEDNLLAADYTSKDIELSASSRIVNQFRTDKDEPVLLDEVTIKGEKFYTRRHTYPDASIIVDEQKEVYRDIFQLMKGRVPGLQIYGSGENTQIRIRGFNWAANTYPLIVLDGIPLNSSETGTSVSNSESEMGDDQKSFVKSKTRNDQNSFVNSILMDIPASSVERIDVLKTYAATSVYGMQGSKGVILIYTKDGPRNYENERTKGYEGFNLPGYHVAREFYSPEYGTEDTMHTELSDLRSTLY